MPATLSFGVPGESTIIKACGNEAKVLANYKVGGGGAKSRRALTGNMAAAIAGQFEMALRVLH